MPIYFYLYCSLELHTWKSTKNALKLYYDKAVLGNSGITKLNEFPAERELYGMIQCSYKDNLKVWRKKKKYKEQHFKDLFAALTSLAAH